MKARRTPQRGKSETSVHMTWYTCINTYLYVRRTGRVYTVIQKNFNQERAEAHEENNQNQCTYTFLFVLRPGEREETPVHTYFSSFRVPVRTRFVSSTLVGPVSDRH